MNELGRRSLETVPPVFDFAARPDIGAFMTAADTGRRQGLEGFDPDYTDIVDYIVRCTHKIWEEKAVGLIYSHYAQNVVVHTSHGVTFGREAIVRNSLAGQAAFTAGRAYADDVIWSGDDQEGFYTSHRLRGSSLNTGPTEHGLATDRRLERWGFADCLVRENRIVEEWIVHDGAASLRQMGFDPLERAKRAVLPSLPFTGGEINRLPGGQHAPSMDVPSGTDPRAFINAVLHNLWNARLVNVVRAHYSPGLVAFVPGERQLYGFGDYENFVITMLASFPDLALTVDHQCVLGDEARGYRVATRFTLQGTHEGHGPYGAPTGRRVFLVGISHHVLRHGRIAREWTLFDEFALLKQLHARQER